MDEVVQDRWPRPCWTGDPGPTSNAGKLGLEEALNVGVRVVLGVKEETGGGGACRVGGKELIDGELWATSDDNPNGEGWALGKSEEDVKNFSLVTFGSRWGLVSHRARTLGCYDFIQTIDDDALWPVRSWPLVIDVPEGTQDEALSLVIEAFVENIRRALECAEEVCLE
jgi:hypothetical protein